jgi:hypothetical protein
MRKVLFITPGPITWASSRMRAHWVAEHLPGSAVIEGSVIDETREIDLHFDDYVFVKVTNADAAGQLVQAGKRVWWDICDPVHWFSPEDARDMADTVTGIVASNQGLADDFSKWHGNIPITVIRDRIKLSHFSKKHTLSDKWPVRFIWYGAGQNRHSLFGAFAYLDRLSSNGIDIALTIMDDNPNEAWKFDKFPIYHIAWSLEQENSIIASHDIAILPTFPGPWGHVKSNNRHVTAWACGIPSTTGEEWNHLYELASSAEYRQVVVNTSAKWVAEYDVEKSAAEWKGLLGYV